MSEMTAKLAFGVSKPTGHVASLKLPIGCRGLKPIVDALESEYGTGLVVKEEPKGWLHISTAAEQKEEERG